MLAFFSFFTRHLQAHMKNDDMDAKNLSPGEMDYRFF